MVVDGKVLDGAHGIGGEWGHNPLPGMTREEVAEAPTCYCGKRGCIENGCSGPALAADFQRHADSAQAGCSAEKIAASDAPEAKAAMAR